MLKTLDLPVAPLRSEARLPGVNRLSHAMGALGLVVILLSTAFIGWREREGSFHEAAYHAQSSATFLADHASRLFEVMDVALRASKAAIADRGWAEIEQSRDLWDLVRATSTALPYVDAVWITDAEGDIRLSTTSQPPPRASAEDRAAFRAVAAAGTDFVIGDPIEDPATRRGTFLVSRRIEASQGGFRGLISATADLDYFRNYWSAFDLQEGESLALVRAGHGTELLHLDTSGGPNPDAETFRAALLTATARHAIEGRFAPGPELTGFYHRVGALPLYMTVIYRNSVVTHSWWVWLWWFLPFPLAAFLALSGIMLVNERRGRAEARARLEVALAQTALSAANHSLEARVAARTADLRESNDEIRRFAYAVSHDLRAPLVNIMGFTMELEGLRPQLFGEQPPEGNPVRQDFDEALGFIRSSIEKMDRLIKAILLLSRQGQRVLVPEPIDMTVLVGSVADGFTQQLLASGAELTVEPLPALITDRVAVEQVFSNLVDNAIKYLRPGVPGRIKVSGDILDGRARFRVADNGRGIEERDRTRVFDLFRRAGPQDQPGEGIGLAHVRSLVWRLGGTITLDSTVGAGSVFTVVLPQFLQEAAA